MKSMDILQTSPRPHSSVQLAAIQMYSLWREIVSYEKNNLFVSEIIVNYKWNIFKVLTSTLILHFKL